MQSRSPPPAKPWRATSPTTCAPSECVPDNPLLRGRAPDTAIPWPEVCARFATLLEQGLPFTAPAIGAYLGLTIRNASELRAIFVTGKRTLSKDKRRMASAFLARLEQRRLHESVRTRWRYMGRWKRSEPYEVRKILDTPGVMPGLPTRVGLKVDLTPAGPTLSTTAYSPNLGRARTHRRIGMG